MNFGKVIPFRSKTGPLVMVVDADFKLSAIAAVRLQRLGYRVVLVENVQEALGSARLQEVSFILLDRGCSGDGAMSRRNLAQLQAAPATAAIPKLLTSLRRELERASLSEERNREPRMSHEYTHQAAPVA